MILRRHDHSAPACRTLCVGLELTMPELPEVETVRRGLQPVMEGARFLKVIAHRGDLRWPLGQDFAARLEGKTVEGLGRRANNRYSILPSGRGPRMHSGISAPFRR